MSTHLFGLVDTAFTYSHSIGRNEFNGTGLRNPMDLAIDEEGRVYVVNRSYENRPDGVRVSIVTMDEDFVGEFSQFGEGPGDLYWPTACALDGNGNLYVADEWLNRITIFDGDGEYISHWGEAGDGAGQFNGPSGIAIDGDTMWVVDSRNHRIQSYGLDGTFKSQFGGFGSGDGQMNLPWGICLDKDGQVYVADWRNDRIQVFSQGGEWQASFGSSGSNPGQFKRPNAVFVDNDGDVYVCDRENDRVQILAPDGRFRAQLKGDHQISGWGKTKLNSNPDMIRQRTMAITHDGGEFEKMFANPCAVRVTPDGQIAILDHTRGRIQVYQKEKEPVLL